MEPNNDEIISDDNGNNENLRESSAVFKEFPPEETAPANTPPTVELSDTNASIASMNAHFSMQEKMYIEILSPQLGKNEELKRKHKDALMDKIFKILNIQFIFTYLLISISIIAIIFSYYLHISDNTIELLIGLFKFYVTAIIGELIAILFFIVKSVFDKSIVDLISNFDHKENKNDKES